uniref:Uncharacterized protein n=1 Tax=Anguilla anguilla TaxID=7936 RepID=A0A0E9PNK3_ANGAN
MQILQKNIYWCPTWGCTCPNPTLIWNVQFAMCNCGPNSPTERVYTSAVPFQNTRCHQPASFNTAGHS